MTRARARSAFASSSARGHRYIVFYCLTPDGIRGGFPAPAALRLLRPGQRHRARGTVVLALTANRHFSLHGVRPGTRLVTVARRLHPGRPFAVGTNRWYLTPGHGVLKVQHGVIQEIGIADARFVRTRAAARTFLRGFS
jgi:hypothetical protein